MPKNSINLTEEQIKEIANLMAETMLKNFGLRFKDFAEVIYNAGYRKENSVHVGELLSDAIDATFRGAVLRLAEKLKQCSYCDNCFKDGKWHRYVFIEDIDATVKKFLESET